MALSKANGGPFFWKVDASAFSCSSRTPQAPGAVPVLTLEENGEINAQLRAWDCAATVQTALRKTKTTKVKVLARADWPFKSWNTVGNCHTAHVSSVIRHSSICRISVSAQSPNHPNHPIATLPSPQKRNDRPCQKRSKLTAAS